MAQAFVDQQYDIVFFLGYRDTSIGTYANEINYCADCIDTVLGIKITPDIEENFLKVGEKRLDQFTEEDYNDKSNYCGWCNNPLIDLKYVDERCQHSKPSSNKQRQYFKRRIRSGPHHGGL